MDAVKDQRFRDTCAGQAQTCSCFTQQQAIEDLQSEEEKVNQLTKEKTKLQMQAEDVSSLYSHNSVCFCVKVTP